MDRIYGGTLKKICAVTVLLCLLLPLCACQHADGSYPVTVQGVTLAHKPKKVLVLSQQLADVVLALGGKEQVIGIGTACAHERWPNKTAVPADNLTALQQLDADLILYTDELSSYTADSLRESGTAVIQIPSAENRADLVRLYSDIGCIFAGKAKGEAAAQTTAAQVLQTLDDITRIVPHSDTLTTAAVIYDLKGHGATGDTFTHSLLTSAGLTDILGGQRDGTYEFSILKTSDPKLLFCPVGVKEEICADPAFAQLTAVKEDRVFEVERALLYGQGRSAVSLAVRFAGCAFPELTEKIPTVVSRVEETDELDPSLYEPLQKGDRSYEVENLQKRLYDLGYMTSFEEKQPFGEATYDAVRKFQSVNGLEVTGDADPYTQALLYSNIAKPKPAEY